MRKVKLPDCGLEVEVKSLSWDEGEAYMAEEAKALDGDSIGKAMGGLARQTIERQYPGLFEQISGSRKDLRTVFKAIVKETFGDLEEEKN